MKKVTIVYFSGYGHTKLQAEAVYAGAASVDGVSATIMTTAEATADLDALDNADAIIFGCPTYMGSMAADMKKFLEVAASKWFKAAWQGKIAGAFTNSSSFSGDKLNTLMGLVINALQHGMIYVGNDIYPSANKPEEMNRIEGPGPDAHNRSGSFVGPMSSSFQVKPPDAPSKGDLETAHAYGIRIANITKKLS